MRTYTREQVAQVVGDMLREANRGKTPVGINYSISVSEVLRRLDALPNPPAAPESSPESKRPILDLYGLKGDIQRPRATTPVPEVPALKGEPHYRCADPDCEAPERPAEYVTDDGVNLFLRCATPGCNKASGFQGPDRYEQSQRAGWTAPDLDVVHCPKNHTTVAAAVQPAPTAPEVVWTGDGVRVLADGTVWDKYAPLWISRECAAIARALAEAKREQRCDHGQPKDYCAQSFNDAVDAAKVRGAESMRERVKSLIMAEQAKQEDGPLSDDNGHAFRLLLRLADAVGALPLEEP